MGLRLYGYRYSVYTHVARMVLAVRGLDYDNCEVNPFDAPPDLHLAPMIGYFAMAESGRAAFGAYPALEAWWHVMSRRPAYTATAPTLATPGADG